MSKFHFVSEWSFDAPLEKVWAQINDPENFPQWWPGFESAKVLFGHGGEIGAVVEFRVKGDFGLTFDFKMTLEEKREPEYLLLHASGDFIGTGEWILHAENGKTDVKYSWHVEVTRPWLRLLSRVPGSRRYLEHSHDRVMEQGYENLSKLLDSESE